MPITANKIIVGIAIWAFGAIVSHLWARYRNRMRQLRLIVGYERLAVAGQDAIYGKVEVRYNNNPVTNLHFATVQLQNESNADLENLVINIACLDGSTTLVSQGVIEGSLAGIPFTDEFSRILGNPQLELFQYLTTRRDYRIPVLNRGTTARFTLLVSRADAAQPNVIVTCDHAGVRLSRHAPAPLVLGIPTMRALLVNLVLGAAITISLITAIRSVWVVALLAWVLGVFGTLLAVGVIKAWRWILKILS